LTNSCINPSFAGSSISLCNPGDDFLTGSYKFQQPTLTIVVADMALVTQDGWITSAQGIAPITIRTLAQYFGGP
jgi:hypothetical protein